MTLSRRGFLGAALAGAAVASLPRGRRARAAATGPKKNLILVFAAGGWDVTYSVDPKPDLETVDVPVGRLGTYDGLDVWEDASRPNIAAFFSAWAGATTIVRGLSVRSIAHEECKKRVLTGTPSAASPDLAAMCAHENGADLPLPYLILGQNAMTGPLASSSGRVGSRNQLVGVLDQGQAYRLPADVAPAGSHFVPGPGDETAMRAFLTARAERERATRGARGYNKRRLDDFQGSLVRGDLLQASADGFGARGRNLNLATQVTLAADVIEQGISRAVQIDTRLGFDTHNNKEQQNDFHNTVFGVLGDLCTDLQGRAGAGAGATLFDETIVVVMSEMSRTPKINGQMGKDHWPVTSALVIGGGAGNGRVLGGTTNKLEARAIDLATGTSIADGPSLQTNNLVAGVLSMAGADPEPWMPGITPLGGFGA